MDFTKISLGAALLVVSSLTVLLPTIFESSLPVYAVTVLALAVTASALFVDVATDDRLPK